MSTVSDPASTHLLLTTNPGLESIVAEELRQRASAAGQPEPGVELRPFGFGGQVIAHGGAGAAGIALQLRSIHHVLQLLYRFDIGDASAPVDLFAAPPGDATDEAAVWLPPIPAPCPEVGRIYGVLRQYGVDALDGAASFRVTTKRHGAHPFTSLDVQRFAGGALIARHGCAVDLVHHEVEVRADVIDRTCIVGVQLSREALSRRVARVHRPRAALKANVAYALLHLARIDAGTTSLLDPFCGSGTILLEAADLYPHLQLFGSDYSVATLAGARRNVGAAGHAGRIALCCCDARRMAAVYGRRFDTIVTNPPYGVRQGQHIDFDRFYDRVFEQAAALLPPCGRLILLSWKRGVVDRTNRRQGLFRSLHARVVETGGIYPRIYVLERRGRGGESNRLR